MELRGWRLERGRGRWSRWSGGRSRGDCPVRKIPAERVPCAERLRLRTRSAGGRGAAPGARKREAVPLPSPDAEQKNPLHGAGYGESFRQCACSGNGLSSAEDRERGQGIRFSGTAGSTCCSHPTMPRQRGRQWPFPSRRRSPYGGCTHRADSVRRCRSSR